MKVQVKPFISRTTINVVRLCLLLLMTAPAAMAAKTEIEFRKKETTQQANELASNVLRVVNRSEKPLRFLLGLNIPDGWKSLNSGNLTYTVASGDSVFIPIKLLFKGNEEGDVSYLIVASLLSESNKLQFASASWNVQVKKHSEWSASVDKIESFFINKSDTSTFSLTIRNTGNATQLLGVKVTPHLGLQAFEYNTMKEIVAPYNISLLPGKDTVLYYLVKRKEITEEYYQNENSREKDEVAGEKFPLRIAVSEVNKDNTSGKIWKATIDFRKVANEIKFNEYARQVLPATVELKFDNIFESSTVMNFNLYGDAKLDRSRTLSYRFQSFFTDQYYNGKAFAGNYHYLGYFTPLAAVEAGNITGWGTFGQTPSGVGLKGDYLFGRNKLGLMYIQSPDLFLTPSVTSIGAIHELKLQKMLISNYFQSTTNDFTISDSKLGITGADFRISRQHVFSFRTGFSNEKFKGAPTPFAKDGMGANMNYSANVKSFNLRASATYGSKFYTGYRGISNLNYGFSYRKNEKITWTFTNSFYKQNPIYLDKFGNELGSFKTRSDRYELRLSISEKANNYSVRAIYNYDDLSSIRYLTRGLGLDYRPASTRSQVRFFSSVLGSYVKLLNFDIQDYFTAQVRTSLRYKSFTSNVRYNYGPYQAYEHLRFATYQKNSQSLFINMYYGFWFLKNTLSLEPSLNFSHETLFKRNRLSIRPQVFYFSKSGFELSMYAEYISNSQKIYSLNESANALPVNESRSYDRNVVFGLGLKKQFGIPLPGKKFHLATVVIFKDLNGNLIQDKNEESIENVLVSIKPEAPDTSSSEDFDKTNGPGQRGEDLITDLKGRVYFRNLPAGTYRISARPLTPNSGWFGGQEQIIIIDKSKEVPMPFTQGVHLFGSILINHNNSLASRNLNPVISRIRVTATDSAGRSFSALTNEEGKFEIYVPAGQYRLTINEKAIDDDYKVEQAVIPANVSGSTGSYNVSFHITERERTVNVKKFNSDGSTKETEGK